MRIAALLFLVTVLSPAAAASAGTVSVDTVAECNGSIVCDKYAGGVPSAQFTFKGAPGERNTVKLTHDTPVTKVTVVDSTAELTAGTNCTKSDSHTAVCDLMKLPLTGFPVELGDSDDVLELGAGWTPRLVVNGGDGNDKIAGGAAWDTLAGGLGADTVSGGAGNDTIEGGDVADPDVFDGGPGVDHLSYANRKNPLSIDLAEGSPGQGEVGEGDTITGIEDLVGGAADDRLFGGEGANTLSGGDGNDRIEARGGADTIVGGLGADLLDGGAGNDSIDSRDNSNGSEPEEDTVGCGAGTDRLGGVDYVGEYFDEPEWYGVDATDVLASDCETVALPFVSREKPVLVDVRVRKKGRNVVVTNPCRASGMPKRCIGKVRIAGRSRTLRRGQRKMTLFVPNAQRGKPLRLSLGVKGGNSVTCTSTVG